MAKIHLYIRTQVTTDDPSPIEAAVDALKQAVETAGGDWHGSATVERDAPPDLVDETMPASEPVSDTDPS